MRTSGGDEIMSGIYEDESGMVLQRSLEVIGMQGLAAELTASHAEITCTPAYALRPKLMIDGNKWCALYGEDLQNGVAGFGDSPAEAYADFNESWKRKLPTISVPVEVTK